MTPRQVASYITKSLLLFFFYYVTAKLGLELGAVSGFAALFWLPTGISLAALFILGYRFFPAIALAAFAVNFSEGATIFASLGIMVGNTLEALVGAFLLKKAEFNRSLEHLKDALSIVFLAAFLSTVISATIGVTSLSLTDSLSTPFTMTWFSWWIGDMLSNLVIAPFLLTWSRRISIHLNHNAIIEGLFIFFLEVSAAFFVFIDYFRLRNYNVSFTYTLFPPLAWASLRFGPKGATLSTLLLSFFTMGCTVLGQGPFVANSPNISLLLLQSFMGVTAVTFLILSSVNAERKQHEKRKDDFISFASHELKTPLTSITIFIDILKKISKNRKDPNTSKYLQRVSNQVHRLTALINDMLDLSRIQSGKMELRKEWFSLNELIEEVVDTMATSNSNKIKIKGKFRKDIYADKDRVEQVLVNLISNAIKYSPAGKPIAILLETGAHNLTVSVKDQGAGIPLVHQKKIFNRFYRVNESNSQSGMGIGLYLSKMIIRRHNGKIWVKNNKGKGSTFSFTLPLKGKSNPATIM